MAVGGMPSAVREYVKSNSFLQVEMEQSSIIQTCRDDFSKYGKKINAALLRTTLEKLPQLVGKKVKYVDISRNERAATIADSISMLQKARLICCIHHSAGSNLPLSAEKKEKDFKPLFLDIGLMMRSLNMRITDLLKQDLVPTNGGAIAEQFIGQQWLYQDEAFREPELFYWNREKRGAAAEVDYLFQIGSMIVPVEVKAGVTGSMKSLHLFAQEKSSPLALRFNLDLPSFHSVEAKAMQDQPHSFNLLSLPLYMVSETERLCRSLR